METLTGQYQFHHSSQPKGFGNWEFKIRAWDKNGERIVGEEGAVGKLNEAKQEAVRKFRVEHPDAVRIESIEVLP